MMSVAFFLIYMSQFKTDRFFTCKSGVNYTVKFSNNSYYLKAAYAIIIDDMKYSTLTINGKLQYGDTTTVLNRSYIMNMTNAKGNYFKVVITSQDINDTDTTDDTVFLKFFMPQKVGVPFYMQISNIKENIFILRGLSAPYLACLSY